MFWIPITIGSYALSAFSATIDKILIRGRIVNPVTFTFFSGITSFGVLVLFPFGFSVPPFAEIIMALSVGILLIAGLFFQYSALNCGDATRVVPIIGGTIPVLLFFISVSFFGEHFSGFKMTALAFFIVGIAFLSYGMKDVEGCSRHGIGNYIFSSLMAALFFTLAFVLTKEVFNRLQFINGFIWMRLGSFIAALFMLLLPFARKQILFTARSATYKKGGAFFGNKFIAALSFFLLNLAIAVAPSGDISIVTAMKGVEYMLVFAIAVILSIFAPRALGESFDGKTLRNKVFGILAVGVGFVFIFIGR